MTEEKEYQMKDIGVSYQGKYEKEEGHGEMKQMSQEKRKKRAI